MQYTFNRINVISHDIKIAPFHKLNQLFESHPLPNSLRDSLNHKQCDQVTILTLYAPTQPIYYSPWAPITKILEFSFRSTGGHFEKWPKHAVGPNFFTGNMWYHSRRFWGGGGGGGGCMGGYRSTWTTILSCEIVHTITIIINFIINSPWKPFSPHGPPCHCHRKNLNQNFMRAFIHPYHRSPFRYLDYTIDIRLWHIGCIQKNLLLCLLLI